MSDLEEYIIKSMSDQIKSDIDSMLIGMFAGTKGPMEQMLDEIDKPRPPLRGRKDSTGSKMPRLHAED